MSSLSYRRYHKKYDPRHVHRDKEAEVDESGIVFVKEGKKVIGTLGDFRSFAYTSNNDSVTAAKLSIFTDYVELTRREENLQCY